MSIKPTQFPENLTQNELVEVESFMAPNNDVNTSIAGFLAPQEHLIDVHNQDAQTLSKLDVTFEQVADRLESVIQMAMQNS